MDTYNKYYCDTFHKLLHLKKLMPVFGDNDAIDALKEATGQLGKIKKAKTTEDKMKLVRAADEALVKYFNAQEIIFPLDPQVLGTHVTKGELIEAHFSVDTLEARKQKIQKGYIVRKEHICMSSHALTEWGFSWVPQSL
jgi:hypothetical protein